MFNPIWTRKDAQSSLDADEVAAIAAHLYRNVFIRDSQLQLPFDAVVWLVSMSEVQDRTRVAPLDASEPDEQDWLYQTGKESTQCTLVLQGRATVLIGRDGFKAEAGAFKVLGKDALNDGTYTTDFSAFLGTERMRYLTIHKKSFQKAAKLSHDEAALEGALRCVSTPRLGEAAARMKGRSLTGWSQAPTEAPTVASI